tara:strand:+ start:51 stop:230 length:180 start_codon:yes stop_codon:yes gene_type:complete
MTKSETKKLQKIESDLWNELQECKRLDDLLGKNGSSLYYRALCKWATVRDVSKAFNVKH